MTTLEIPTVSVSEAKKFYGSIFGWKFEDYGPEYVSFMDGRLSGGFNQEIKVVKNAGPLIIIYSTDLKDTRKKILGAGGKIVKEIFEFPGGRRFHFTDPSGNELAVWSDK